MKSVCLVVILSLMILCVTSRQISRPQSPGVYEDPENCHQDCYDDCCQSDEGVNECSTPGSEQTDVCNSECTNRCQKRSLADLMKKRRRTQFLQDPENCHQDCYDDCCQSDEGVNECSIPGSEQTDVCNSECTNQCQKRSLTGRMAKRRRNFLEALMAKRGDNEEATGEYPTESSYYVNPSCASCMETDCEGLSEVVCRELCACPVNV